MRVPVSLPFSFPKALAGPLAIAATLVALHACSGGSSAPSAGAGAAAPSMAVSASALTEARTIFAQRCTVCHGQTGAGDGAAAAALNPKPRAFSDAAWQAGVSDEHLEKVIREGGAAVGKSAAMPGNPDLAAKPEVIAGLRQVVREFKK